MNDKALFIHASHHATSMKKLYILATSYANPTTRVGVAFVWKTTSTLCKNSIVQKQGYKYLYFVAWCGAAWRMCERGLRDYLC